VDVPTQSYPSMRTPSRTDEPSPGDLLISTEEGVHFLSVVPREHCLRFRHLPHAINMALNWANANGSEVWRKTDGRTFRLK
jgi:hypothetical protein